MKTSSERISAAIATTSAKNGTGTNKRKASAMEPRSAPMLNELAATTSVTAIHMIGLA